jgi:hypothetical protein
VPSYTFVAKKPLLVGDGYRDVGELVPEAVTWSNVDAYVARGDLERVAVASQAEQKAAIFKAGPAPVRTYAPDDYDERTPTPVRVGERVAGDDEQRIRCFNCARGNWLPSELVDSATWMCHHCHQLQSIREAVAYPYPNLTSLMIGWANGEVLAMSRPQERCWLLSGLWGWSSSHHQSHGH